MAMEDCKSVILMLQGEENLVAAAQQIARALGTKKNFTDEERKILSDVVKQLSSMSTLNESKSEEVSEIDEQISEEVCEIHEQINEEVSEIEERLNLVQEKVMSWETEQSMIWDSSPEEASEYLNAVDEARKLTQSLESSSLDEGGKDNKLFKRAHDVLQMGMARLEKEFRHMLIHNRQPMLEKEFRHMLFSYHYLLCSQGLRLEELTLKTKVLLGISEFVWEGTFLACWMAMEDCKSVIPMLEGEENLVAPAQQIARALGTKKNFTDEERKILADLVAQLSSISLNESKSEEVSEIDEQISEEVSKIDEQINEEVGEIDEQISEEVSKIDEQNNEEVGEIDEQINEEVGEIDEQISEEVSQIDEQINEEVGEIDEQISEEVSKIDEQINEEVGEIHEQISEEVSQIDEQNNEEVGDIDEQISEEVSEIDEQINEEVDEIHEQISEEVSQIDEQINEEVSEIEKRLNLVQETVMSWETEQSMIWDSGPEEASEYLNAVDEARKLTESLESSSLDEGGEDNKLFRRAHDVLQMGMARLEKEFRHMLIHNREPIVPEYVSFRSNEEAVGDVGSIISFEDELGRGSIRSDSISSFPEGYILDVVHSDVISDLKSIANLMFISNYDQECSRAYICARKDALDECLFILDLQKLSTEDVLKMEWDSLNLKMKRWIQAMKIFMRVYLAGEKWLSDQIFGELGSISSICFVEASKVSILQLLNSGEAIAICPPQHEKVFRILDMCEVLTKELPDIHALFPDEVGGSVRMECHEVLRRLGDFVKATFLDFENKVASNTTANPFTGGGIHPLTKYVMNYISTLTDYRDTLNFLLADHDREDSILLSSPDMSPHMEEESSSSISISASSSCIVSPMVVHFRPVVSILECNLEDKSKLYRDAALQHLFLMNNISYMAQKVDGSELRVVFGDGWIRKHILKFQQHAMSYERATWRSILSLLKDEGVRNPGSHSVSKTLVNERLRNFNVAFEEVYKTQTAWVIPDHQLREDLRISISLKVLQAYRSFVRRFTYDISNKYIKYTVDDIETYLFDLFEGSPRSLQNRQRK